MKSWFVFLCLISIPAHAALPFAINDWAIQLTQYDSNLDKIKNSKFDLVVIDYSRSGDEASEFTPDEISSLKTAGPCGGRLVLAYMNIGEAQQNRFYFSQLSESILGPQDPETGDFRVKFFTKEWKKVIQGVRSGADKSYLDRVIDAGFDGVYLDGIDSFQFWGPAEIGGNDTNRKAARLMIKFVKKLAKYARVKRDKPDFVVFVQNGANILDPDAYAYSGNPTPEAAKQKQRYFKAIDGISAEDTFFVGQKENNNGFNPREDVIAFLDQFVSEGETTFAIDYVSNSSKVSTLYNEAQRKDYVPYANRRELDSLKINNQFPPDCPASTAFSVDCNANPRSGTAPVDVTLTATPSGAIGTPSFSWTFDDGSSTTTANASVVHRYVTANTFHPRVTASTATQSDSCTTTVTVSGGGTTSGQISASPLPFPDFNIPVSGQDVDQDLTVTNLGNGNLTVSPVNDTNIQDNTNNGCYQFFILGENCSQSPLAPNGGNCKIAIRCHGICFTTTHPATLNIDSTDPDPGDNPFKVDLNCQVLLD